MYVDKKFLNRNLYFPVGGTPERLVIALAYRYEEPQE